MKDHYENPGLLITDQNLAGEVVWRSPSNIAFIKYWGKYGHQLPKNASLSMSLTESFTETSLQFKFTKGEPKWQFYFENQENPVFANRIWKYFSGLSAIYPYLHQLDITIDTKNSFPHSTGIASSASAFSALALCLVDMEKQIFQPQLSDFDFFTKASYLARMGSGSAARSVFGGYSIWGAAKSVSELTENKYAIAFTNEIHPVFQQLNDAILIVDRGVKSVSSSAGHSLMDQHPYADDRMNQASKNLSAVVLAIKDGHIQEFIRILENEALSLHALMMSGNPWFILMKPQTLQILERIKEFRQNTGYFIGFTLDAGPNVHVVYGNENELEIVQFIEKELKPLCFNHQIIYDKIGVGPKKIK